MKVYFRIDAPDFGEQKEDALAALNAWVAERAEHATLINAEDEQGWQLGADLNVKAAKQLIEPLNGLYAFSKQFRCDFVVGFFDGDSQEDVCYFGNEEGKPDAFEVACYLGIE